MMKIYDDIIAQYQPGGSFGEGALALYEQGKTKAMATGMQNLVSSGLSNTTVAAGLPIKYEEEVGTPFRLQLEDLRQTRLADALMKKAGAVESRTDAYPDANLLSNLASGAASTAGGGGSSGLGAGLGSMWGNSIGGSSSSGQSSIMPSSSASQDSGITGRFGTTGGSGGLFANSGLTGVSGGSVTPSMDEKEYQELLAQNMAANNLSSAAAPEPFSYVPEGEGAQAGPSTGTQGQSDKVRVQKPDGSIITITRGQLQGIYDTATRYPTAANKSYVSALKVLD
jgi:hypothetical protein